MTEPSPSSEPAQQSPVPPRAAGSCNKSWLFFLAAVALFLGIDLGSKYLAFAYIADAPVSLDRTTIVQILRSDPRALQAVVPRHEPVIVAPSLLEFKLVLNPGAVFGTGAGMRWFFIGFTFVALAIATYLFARVTTTRERFTHTAIALVVAGGLGNLYDRLVYACVRDFIHPLPGVKNPITGNELWPYVSNVADAFLLVGIAFVMIKLWRHEGGAQPDEPGEGATPSAS